PLLHILVDSPKYVVAAQGDAVGETIIRDGIGDGVGHVTLRRLVVVPFGFVFHYRPLEIGAEKRSVSRIGNVVVDGGTKGEAVTSLFYIDGRARKRIPGRIDHEQTGVAFANLLDARVCQRFPVIALEVEVVRIKTHAGGGSLHVKSQRG